MTTVNTPPAVDVDADSSASASASAEKAAASPWRRRGSSWLVKGNLLIVFVVIVVIASLLSPDFLTVRNLSNLLQQSSLTGIIAIGMTLVILTSGIDLSVGSTAALSGMIVAITLDGSVPIPLAILLALVVGLAVGLVMGAIAAWIRLPAFIVTLAGLTAIRGAAYLTTDGRPVGQNLPESFTLIGGGYMGFIPITGLIFIVVALLAAALLRFTTFGEYIYAVGSNEEAARLSGVPVKWVQMAVFGISGLTAALAGILLTSRLTIAQPTSFTGAELDGIAAVVLGGAALAGGRGGIGGTFIAVLLLSVLKNLFNLMGIGSFFQMVATGLILLLALILNKFIDSRARNIS
ncbi:ribonucleotide-diphosphate reductase subunit alpha [Subtercola boreus]|uniref:Ribonucleotide-diphosphate reductase subunit alpha n=1 Tax=Subtercola boreus TaxID=120213 RepID=A0A3E0W5P2_9MICO|nr:ABC transporter permease [Subtercola boreus]RFA16798.1 ribonucleotide-diphosphate reductase subunit alpha [Subtercola boreus]